MIYDTQQICALKEAVYCPLMPAKIGDNHLSIEEINQLLSKGWVILKITSLTQIDKDSDNNQTLIYERQVILLGFPEQGVSLLADDYRSEFFPSER